jgi:uncharacterized protein YbjT (DUF2867 family)
MKIAVTGATGYIGGRLVPRLLSEGHQVVCLARTPGKLDDRPWRSSVEVRQCDVLDLNQVDAALDGCDAAYYLVHSMGSADDFAETDRIAAANFSKAAAANNLQRIVYLGGLGSDDELSSHLASRQEVGATLASGPTPVTELRAAVVIGSGSVSFEMLRYLTEVLPVMVTPRWVGTRCQPIAIRDVLSYLVASLDDDPGNHVYDIGGPNVVTYREMMMEYAAVARLHRRIIVPVPVLSPRLSSLWIGLVTPLPVGVARPLVDSLRNEVTVHNEPADSFNIQPMPLRTAIERALDHSAELDIESRWSDASSSPAQPFSWDPSWAGGTLLLDRQTVTADANPSDVFWAFSRIGGATGYYTYNWAWRVRGVFDTLVGGAGLRRGRRHPEDVRLHDTIDFWRVSAVVRDEYLQLSAEMRLPGDAWLEWRTKPTASGSTLEQTAFFRPRGLAGRLYWFLVLPAHRLIFGRMARKIAEAAENHAQLADGSSTAKGTNLP